MWTATLDRLTVAGRMPRQLLSGTGPKEAMAQAQTLGGALLLPAAMFTYALQVGWFSNHSTCIFAPFAASSCSDEWLIVTHASSVVKTCCPVAALYSHVQTAVVKQDLPSSVFKIVNATMAAAALIHVRVCCLRCALLSLQHIAHLV